MTMHRLTIRTVLTTSAALAATLALTVGVAGCSSRGTTAAAPATTAAAPVAEATESAAAAAPQYTVSQQSAIDKANSYLKFQPFSRQGLIDQLSSQIEGFSVEDATVAVDSLNADWNAQAALKAKQYMDTIGGFSHQSLVDQLTSQIDGFTPEQAEFGVTSIGL